MYSVTVRQKINILSNIHKKIGWLDHTDIDQQRLLNGWIRDSKRPMSVLKILIHRSNLENTAAQWRHSKADAGNSEGCVWVWTAAVQIIWRSTSKTSNNMSKQKTNTSFGILRWFGCCRSENPNKESRWGWFQRQLGRRTVTVFKVNTLYSTALY